MLALIVNDHLHLYWRIDDYNVADGGKRRLDDGTLISTTYDPAGGTGRCLLDFYDYDGDGRRDLRRSIPDVMASSAARSTAVT